MSNPINTVLTLQLTMLYQYLAMTKQMLDVFLVYQPVAVQALTPTLTSGIGLRRGGCVGPADLKS